MGKGDKRQSRERRVRTVVVRRRGVSARRAYGLALLSALVLGLAFPPFEVSWAAYVALVPLLVMALRTASRRRVFLAGTVGGLVFFGASFYWVAPLTWVGWLALSAYLALYWGVFAWGVRWVSEGVRVPLTVLAPAAWVALELVRGWLMTGLPWVLVGHTQYENLWLIQMADVVGVYGVSFLVVATSGLMTDVLTRPLFLRREAGARPRVSPAAVAMVAAVALGWAATVFYGVRRLGQETMRPGPVVASVQTNVPQEVKLQARRSEVLQLERQMLDAQLGLTREASAEARRRGEGLDLVVWPETMVPGYLNAGFLKADLSVLGDDREAQVAFGGRQARCRGYWDEVHGAAVEAGAPVLCGATAVWLEGAVRVPGGGMLPKGPRMNAAVLIAPDSERYTEAGLYAKAHLVPFGEAVPFRESWPWLHRALHAFTPYRGMDYSLAAGGRDQRPFGLEFGKGETARFQAAICYEDAFAYRVREMARLVGDPPRKGIDLLVNISNDGWFAGSIELDQHLNLCVFRAVENRVAVVRSVNTGISALIGPEGRIEQAVTGPDGGRRGVAGWVVGRIRLDRRVAPYTVVGDAFARLCAAGTGVLVVVAGVRRGRRRKEKAL